LFSSTPQPLKSGFPPGNIFLISYDKSISPDTAFLPADPNFSNDVNVDALAGNILDN